MKPGFLKGLLLFLTVTPSISAAGLDCFRSLKSGQFLRRADSFSADIVHQHAKKHSETLSNQTLRANTDERISTLLNEMLRQLITATNLENEVADPFAIKILVLDSRPEEIPFAQMKVGVLIINTAMLAFLETDDELAAVSGEELLHHTLKHDLRVLETLNGRVVKFLMKRSNSDSFPLMKTPNFFRELLEIKIERLKDGHEIEAQERLPHLLAKAGYDPWAKAKMFPRFIAQTKDAPPIFLDGYTRGKLRKRNALMIEYLEKKKIVPAESGKKDFISRIHELITSPQE